MDNLENYEESYAIAEEFREWILNIRHDEDVLKDYVLMIPKNLNSLLEKKTQDKY